ncbi:hypothetical protein [Flavobacterium bizetiae]|uniref:hypothetical protein n=1 Tax=Flavobacterium bizetiae TaxID=2704140 RepID=UPI003756AD51
MKARKLLLALFFCITYTSHAMPDLPVPQPRGIPPVGDQVPIDNEIAILFASGILLGIFFILRKSKSTV